MVQSMVLLGSTGSIGTQALEVARELNIKVKAMTAGKNISLFEKQIREFKPSIVAMSDEQAAKELKIKIADLNIKILSGIEGISEIACLQDTDIVLNSVSGVAGLIPTLNAINHKKNIALANKETLVAGGSVVKNAIKENQVKLLPVDSEHSAIFQCLQGAPKNGKISKLLLTCSGGPFFGKNTKELENITPQDALKHPNWNMGAKITIDSATLFNKGLELIEACWLFDVNPDQVEVIIHRESIIHSLVEFEDGSVIGQLGVPNMKLPIQYALTYPDRVNSNVKRLSLTDCKNLSFYQPDYNTFHGIELCSKALKIGGLAPAAINGANEQAVSLFLENKIKFNDIVSLSERVLETNQWNKEVTLDNILLADKESRNLVLSYIS